MTKEESNVYYVGGEVGYNLLLTGKVILRPYAGAGLEHVKSHVEISGTSPTDASTSDSGLYLSPGVSVIAGVDRFFAGGDARYVFYTQQTDGSASDRERYARPEFRWFDLRPAPGRDVALPARKRRSNQKRISSSFQDWEPSFGVTIGE